MATRTSNVNKRATFLRAAFLKERLRVLREKLLDCEKAQKIMQSKLAEEKEEISFSETGHYPAVIDEEPNVRLLNKCAELIPELQRAIKKIERNPDAYGMCEKSGRRMSQKRLVAIPWARYCHGCQKKKES